MKKLMLISLIAVLIASTFALPGCYSCQTWNHMWGKGERADFPDKQFFWDKECKKIGEEKAPAKSTCGANQAATNYPCGACGIVKLEEVLPSEVSINSQFNYTIIVTNLTESDVTDIVVTEKTPANFKYVSSTPAAKVGDGELKWTIAELAADDSETITVTGMATTTDCVKLCGTVKYVVPTCAAISVVQPKLALTKTAPAQVTLCEPITTKYRVSNTGTGTLSGVQISDALPTGLLTADGKSNVAINVGTLTAGQTREFAASLKASKPGKYTNTAVATAAGGLKIEASAATNVVQPVLAITKTGPATIYLGRVGTYQITVTNKGNTPATNLVIEDISPTNAKFVEASNSGIASAGKVIWKMASLAPGASVTVSAKYQALTAGNISNKAVATAVCAEAVAATVSTSTTGIPAILLEVIDITDPVEVGTNTTYVITATNQGSSPGTNIKIVATLESGMEFVSCSGATNGALAENIVSFQPLSSLAPGAKATWRVVVKAKDADDKRFKVSMTSSELKRPVEETESTNFYK